MVFFLLRAHKHINERTMLDRLHQVFQHQEEVTSDPIIFQPIDKIFQNKAHYSGEEQPLREASGFQPFDKPLKTGLEELSVDPPPNKSKEFVF